MSTQVVRVQERGQVTIPPEIRQKPNLKKRDLITFVVTEDGMIIKPAEVILAEAFNEIGKVLKEKGISLEELVGRGRKIRGDLIAEEYGLADTQSARRGGRKRKS
jgi:AbrB family looped-hinge helix DNA binding protein